MTNYSSYYNRQRLEKIYRRSHTSVYLAHQVQQWLTRLGRHTLAWLTADGYRPHIVQVPTGSGVLCWQVYDPITQHRSTFKSEQDVRAWLETRYYR